MFVDFEANGKQMVPSPAPPPPKEEEKKPKKDKSGSKKDKKGKKSKKKAPEKPEPPSNGDKKNKKKKKKDSKAKPESGATASSKTKRPSTPSQKDRKSPKKPEEQSSATKKNKKKKKQKPSPSDGPAHIAPGAVALAAAASPPAAPVAPPTAEISQLPAVPSDTVPLVPSPTDTSSSSLPAVASGEPASVVAPVPQRSDGTTAASPIALEPSGDVDNGRARPKHVIATPEQIQKAKLPKGFAWEPETLKQEGGTPSPASAAGPVLGTEGPPAKRERKKSSVYSSSDFIEPDKAMRIELKRSGFSSKHHRSADAVVTSDAAPYVASPVPALPPAPLETPEEREKRLEREAKEKKRSELLAKLASVEQQLAFLTPVVAAQNAALQAAAAAQQAAEAAAKLQQQAAALAAAGSAPSVEAVAAAAAFAKEAATAATAAALAAGKPPPQQILPPELQPQRPPPLHSSQPAQRRSNGGGGGGGGGSAIKIKRRPKPPTSLHDDFEFDSDDAEDDDDLSISKRARRRNSVPTPTLSSSRPHRVRTTRPTGAEGAAETMRRHCLVLIKELMKHRDSWPFNTPVDPVALGIPDYFAIVKNPMDFGTVKRRLENGEDDFVEEFEQDTRQVFTNAFAYNRAGSDICVMAENVKQYFERKLPGLKERIEADVSGAVGFDASATGEQQTAGDMDEIQLGASMTVESPPTSPPGAQMASPPPRQRQRSQSQPGVVHVGPGRPRKREDATPMTLDEKRQLSVGINNLSSAQLGVVVQIIHDRMPHLTRTNNPFEIEIDIDTLDAATLRALERYVKSCQAPSTTASAPASSTSLATSSSAVAAPVTSPPLPSAAAIASQLPPPRPVSPSKRKPAAAAIPRVTSADGKIVPPEETGTTQKIKDVERQLKELNERTRAMHARKAMTKSGGSTTGGAEADAESSSSLDSSQHLHSRPTPDLSDPLLAVKHEVTEGAAPRILPAAAQKKDVVLQNEDSWAKLEDTASNASGMSQPTSPPLSSSKPVSPPTGGAPASLWSAFRSKEAQAKQREKEREEAEEKLRREREAAEEERKREEERRKKAAEEAEVARKLAEQEAAKVREEEAKRDREAARQAARLEREAQLGAVPSLDLHEHSSNVLAQFEAELSAPPAEPMEVSPLADLATSAAAPSSEAPSSATAAPLP